MLTLQTRLAGKQICIFSGCCFFFNKFFGSKTQVCRNNFIVLPNLSNKVKVGWAEPGTGDWVTAPSQLRLFLHLLDPRLNFWLFNAEIIRFCLQCLFLLISRCARAVWLREFEMFEGQNLDRRLFCLKIFFEGGKKKASLFHKNQKKN